MTRGLSDRQIAKIRINFLTDNAVIERSTGQGATGLVTWSVIDPASTPCRMIEKNTFAYSAGSIDQLYDAQVIVGGEVPLQSKGPRYRVTVTTFTIDPVNGDQVNDRVRVFEVLNVDALRDSSGAHVFQSLRCKNA